MKSKIVLLFWILVFVLIFPASAGANTVSPISTGDPVKAAPLSCVAVHVTWPTATPTPTNPIWSLNGVQFSFDASGCDSADLSQLSAGIIFILDLSQYDTHQSPIFTNPPVQFSTIDPYPSAFVPANNVFFSNANFTTSIVVPSTVATIVPPKTLQSITLNFNFSSTPVTSASAYSAIQNDVNTSVAVYALKSFTGSATISDGDIPAGFSTALSPVQYPALTLQWCSNGYNTQDTTCSTGTWVTTGVGSFTQWEQNWSAYGLPYGVYKLSGNTLSSESNGAVFSPVQAQPFIVVPLSTNTARLAYIQTSNADGVVNIQMPAQPSGTGVASTVVAQLVDPNDPSDVFASISLPWGTTTAISNLAPEKTFALHFDPFFYINGTGEGQVLKAAILTPGSSSFNPAVSPPTVTVTAQISDAASWIEYFSATTVPSVPSSTKGSVVLSGTVVLDSVSYPVALTESLNLDASVQALVVPGSVSANYSVPNIAYKTSNSMGYFMPNITHGTVQPPPSAQMIKYTYYPIPQVNGWPTGHMSMGNLTGDGGVGPEGLTARQAAIDALFKYAGSNGAGDRGQVWPPIWTHSTVEEAIELSASKTQPVIPVMVEYTAQMSGGTSYDDINNQQTVAMHFTNLAFDTNDMAYSMKNEGLSGASIVLNPDLFGMIAQNGLQSSIDKSFVSNPINIQQAVASACCMVGLFPEPTIRGLTNQIPADQFGNCFPTSQQPPLPTTCTLPVSGKQVTIPTFASGAAGASTFADWVAANNWIVRNFGGANMSFGWMLNIWSADNKQDPKLPAPSYACATASATWLHFAKTSDDIKACYSNLNLSVLNYYDVYNGQVGTAYQPTSNPVPDYVAFDKYEMDVVPGAVGVGYLFNYRDWTNYFTAIQYVSQGLAVGRTPAPVMLFQMPGGHIRSQNDVDTRTGHISTIPDYIFGDPLLKSDFSGAANLNNYLDTTLDDTIYNCASLGGDNPCTVRGYLTAQSQDWTESNMDTLVKTSVFAILWGGGTGPTTSIALYPTDDNGWLAGKIQGTLSSQ